MGGSRIEVEDWFARHKGQPGSLRSYFDLSVLASADTWLFVTGNYVVPQYLALVAGIVVQPYFAKYQETRTWPGFHDISGWIVFSIIVGIVIFPGVYKKTFDPGTPLVVQLGAIFVGV
jgi:hypothetical protein